MPDFRVGVRCGLRVDLRGRGGEDVGEVALRALVIEREAEDEVV